MAEQIFRSPGFYESEIETQVPGQQPSGVPYGLIGASERGPAFVPVTVATTAEFSTVFGNKDATYPAVYAADEVLKNKGALTFIRVLGGGANATTADFSTTSQNGTVKNAGVQVTGSVSQTPVDDGRRSGTIQFLTARHKIDASANAPSEWRGFPIFSDNNSFTPSLGDTLNIVRGIIAAPTGSRIMVLDMTGSAWSGTGATIDDIASIDASSSSSTYKNFKIVISSSLGSSFAQTEGVAGIKVLTASLDPSAQNYISKVLNTDPKRFVTEQHCLYLDLPVENEIVSIDTAGDSQICIASASANWSGILGRFDTRYTTPRSTEIISQPFGNNEFDLFHFETRGDGISSNDIYKISITNVKASEDQKYPFGSFTVVVRDMSDTDTSQKVLETWSGCNLDSQSPNFIAKKIGDRRIRFNFDAVDEDERRLLVQGKYKNNSNRICVVMSSQFDKGLVPQSALPFGFRGIPVIRTSQTLTDTETRLIEGSKVFGTLALPRLEAFSSVAQTLSGSILPPLPFRFKVTRGTVDGSSYTGSPGNLEIPDSRLHWGVKFEKVPTTGSVENAIMNANASNEFNPLITSYAKFQGIAKLDALVTGSDADAFNGNKFTLARVALSNQLISDVTGTAEAHIKETAYIRNGVPNSTTYVVSDGVIDRITFASLLSGSAQTFNKFSDFTKFSTMFYGGWDGTNIFDAAAAELGDKATSTDVGGRAASGNEPVLVTGLGYNPAGSELQNSAINSYLAAAKLMTDKQTSSVNLIAIPGIKEQIITDYLIRRLPDYGLAMFIMDIPSMSDTNTRLYSDSTSRPNVEKTKNDLVNRGINSPYVTTYWPEVFINDNSKKVKIPASVAALGAFAYNDKVTYPWYAPAGFNRGALDFVKNVDVRLTALDKNMLHDAAINSIATFPSNGYVIFAQKTLNADATFLQKVNIVRMLVEVKRIVAGIAKYIMFEPNNAQTRKKFVDNITPALALIKKQAGINDYKITIDESNNTNDDINNHKMNGTIKIVPTASIEYVAIDFVITPAGVEFP